MIPIISGEFRLNGQKDQSAWRHLLMVLLPGLVLILALGERLPVAPGMALGGVAGIYVIMRVRAIRQRQFHCGACGEGMPDNREGYCTPCERYNVVGTLPFKSVLDHREWQVIQRLFTASMVLLVVGSTGLLAWAGWGYLPKQFNPGDSPPATLQILVENQENKRVIKPWLLAKDFTQRSVWHFYAQPGSGETTSEGIGEGRWWIKQESNGSVHVRVELTTHRLDAPGYHESEYRLTGDHLEPLYHNTDAGIPALVMTLLTVGMLWGGPIFILTGITIWLYRFFRRWGQKG
ncbi:MAG: hypothetical protein HQL52_04320 [Magnetococcales bacterium]|nr:hypothetical protein [Magnetococcales bacterium]